MYKIIFNTLSFLFHQFIESAEKRMDCRFNRTRENAIRNSTSPLFKGVIICDEDFTISFHKKKELKMQQCWAVGFSILELSKFIMQRAYYQQIQPRLGGWRGCNVIFSDTDSFLLQVRGKTTEEAFNALSFIMDFSNLNPAHYLFSNKRAKKLGYFKNEIPHAEIVEVVALKSKTYVLRTQQQLQKEEIIRRAKGVTRAVKEQLSFDTFKRCLSEMREVSVLQFSLRAQNHVNLLMRQEKIAFTSFDDKRFLCCSIHSVPYGSVLRHVWRERCEANENDPIFGLFPIEATDDTGREAIKRSCFFCYIENDFGDGGDLVKLNERGECAHCASCNCGKCYDVCLKKANCVFCGEHLPYGMIARVYNAPNVAVTQQSLLNRRQRFLLELRYDEK